MTTASTRRTYSLRLHLVLIAMFCMLPALVISGYLVLRLAERESEHDQEEILLTARTMAAAIDRQIQTQIDVLNALVSAPELRNRDHESFFRHAAEVAKGHDASILLIAPDGTRLFDTGLAYGSPKAQVVNAERVRRVASSMKPETSDVFRVPSGRSLVGVYVPVVLDGKAPFVLGMVRSVTKFSEVFTEVQRSGTWIGTIVDANGVILARNLRAETFVGQPAPDALRSRLTGNREAIFTADTLEGVPTYAASSPSRLSGWLIAVGVPKAEIDQTIFNFLKAILAGMPVAVFLGLLIALVIGNQIRRSLRALAKSTLALGRGQPIEPVRTTIQEIALIANAENVAHDLLQERARERDRAAATSRRMREHLMIAQSVAQTGSIEWDAATDALTWSGETFRILDFDPTGGQPDLETFMRQVDERDRDKAPIPFDLLHRGETPPPVEYRYRTTGGGERIIFREFRLLPKADGTPERAIAILRDITELRHAERKRREAESQLLHAQKLESLGTLAGGIAHDLNNTLVPVIGITKMMRNKFPEASPQREQLDLILEGGERAKELVKQVLAFSRAEPSQKIALDLGAVLRDSLKLLRASLPSTIVLQERIEPVPQISADRAQMHQIILNLATNAAQAIGDHMGTIDVILTKAGSSVRLTVTDTGKGMDDLTLRRIFEPFFTTKDVGEGTGLGLSVVHGIVSDHQGTISVTSEVGAGSRFDIEFPIPEVTMTASRETMS